MNLIMRIGDTRLPATVRTEYHPARYGYVTAIYADLGGKPLPEGAHTGDELLDPETRPNARSRIVGVLRKAGDALSVVQLARILCVPRGSVSAAVLNDPSGALVYVGDVRLRNGSTTKLVGLSEWAQ